MKLKRIVGGFLVSIIGKRQQSLKFNVKMTDGFLVIARNREPSLKMKVIKLLMVSLLLLLEK